MQTKHATLKELLQRSNRHLQSAVNTQINSPARLKRAIEYALLSGGKRLRPLLVYASGLSFNADINDLDCPATAVELIHAYSLVHDDLPAMDNDALRRGKPTCHIAFDEATAILAGDAMQALAFELLSSGHGTSLLDSQRIKMIKTLSYACGSEGMAGGQSLDLLATGNSKLDAKQIEQIHSLKTGALISASILLGALAAKETPPGTFKKLEHSANQIGLAFQIHDDILDIESSTELLGKTQGADQSLNKATYPSVIGIAQSKTIRDQLANEALTTLEQIDADTSLLNNLFKTMVDRCF